MWYGAAARRAAERRQRSAAPAAAAAKNMAQWVGKEPQLRRVMCPVHQYGEGRGLGSNKALPWGGKDIMLRLLRMWRSSVSPLGPLPAHQPLPHAASTLTRTQQARVWGPWRAG